MTDIEDGLLRSSPSRRTVIAGAGFSIGVNPELMPTTDQLGNMAAARAGLGDSVPTFAGGQFETWLSRLAEDQPDLAPARNAQNRERFLRLAAGIHEVMVESQAASRSSRSTTTHSLKVVSEPLTSTR
jgi:hypothetical protein